LLYKVGRSVFSVEAIGGVSLREGVSGVKVPKALRDFERDLVACHKLKNL